MKKEVFVITPIGKKGSDKFKKYEAILKSLIEPTIKSIDNDFNIIRADKIAKPGSFVKDILSNLKNAYIVIADLSEPNPNVFYELGVRHTLSNRTIIITENIDTLPSDLKEYRAIEYDADITGIEEFRKNLTNTINEIIDNPNMPDNPVQDRLGEIIKSNESFLEKEIEVLKNKPKHTNEKTKRLINQDITKKIIDRILKLWNAEERATSQLWLDTDENGKDIEFRVPPPEGNFEFYFIKETVKKEQIYSALIISIHNVDFDIDSDLADVRVMISNYNNVGTLRVKFIIAYDSNMKGDIKKSQDFFNRALTIAKINNKDRFSFEIWDSEKLITIEKELGLK